MASADELIYLDYNATTPLDPEVKEAITGCLELYGNPSSSHALGRAAKEKYESSRAAIADLVNADPDEIVIMSCGTETINYCLRGAAHSARALGYGSHIVTSAIEHDAVLATVDYLVHSEGFTSTVVPVDGHGTVTAEAIRAALTPETVLVSVMHSNNEVGTINPIAEIAAALRAYASSSSNGHGHPILFHSDTSQSLGKVAIDARALGVDYLTVTGHKLYAPKGIGALFVKKNPQKVSSSTTSSSTTSSSNNGGGDGDDSSSSSSSSGSSGDGEVAPPPVKLRKLMHGAGHEGGARAGTENTLLAAGLGAACAVARRELAASATHLAAMRDRLQATFAARAAEDASATATTAAGVDAKKPFEIRVNGQPDDARRLPNTLSVSFRGVLASAVMAKVESRVACSAGAACHSHDDDRVSHVLRAMAVPLDYARGTLRLSVGKHTTKGEVDEAARLIIAAVESLL